MHVRTRLFSLLFLMVAVAMLVPPTALAVNGTWVPTTAGTGYLWSTATNWSSNPTIPGTTAGDVIGLNNDITGAQTITINTTSRTVGTLNIGDSNNSHAFTLAASGGGTLIFDNGGVAAALNEVGSVVDIINAPIVLNDDLAASIAGGLTLGGNITTSSGRTLTKTGAGTLTIANNNTHSANISSATGFTLSTAGTTTFNGNVTNSAGTILISGAGTTLAGSGLLTLSGGTTLSVPNSGAGTVINMDQRWNGNFSTTLVSASSQTITSNGDILLGASLTVSNKLHMVVNGDISETGGSRSLNLTNNGGAATFTFSGNNTYSGGTTLTSGVLNINSPTAIGTGTLTLPGNTIDNTSAGPVTLSTNNAQAWNGNFAFTGTRDLNLGTGAVTMNANRIVTVTAGTLTVGGAIGETGGARTFTLGGAGTLNLTGANTFTGAVTIGNNTAGTLRLTVNSIRNVSGGASALGAPTSTANGIIQIGATSNNSTLEFAGLSADQSSNRQVRIGSNGNGSGGAFILNNDADNTVTFSNAAFNVAATGITSTNRVLRLGGSNSGNNTISGAIIDNGGTAPWGLVGLTKQDAGKWILLGNNTYTGTTTINGGTLQIGNAGGTGTLSTASVITNNATLAFNRTGTITQGTNFGNIDGNGVVAQNGTGTLVLGTGSSYTGGTRVTTGTLQLASGATVLGSAAGALTVNGGVVDMNNNSLTVGNLTGTGGTIQGSSGTRTFTIGQGDGTGGNYQGVIADGTGGTTSLVKTGTGTITLSGNNTYTGGTTVNGGSLIVNGSLASSSFVVDGSLGGSGVLANAVLSGSGSINPGNSLGVLTAAGTDPTGGLDYNFEFTAANTLPDWNVPSNSINDVLRLTSGTPFTANLGGTNTVNVYLGVVSVSAGDVFTGGFYTDNNTSFLSAIENADFQYFLFNGVTYDPYVGPAITVQTVAQPADFGSGTVNGFTSRFVVVPEPATIALLGAGVAFLGLRLARRRKATTN